MSLLIDVSIDTDSIAKAAWARAVANRERLNRRLGTQRAVEEAARDQPINTINGRTLFNPLVTNYKPDEPVTPPSARSLDPTWLLTPFNAGLDAIVRGMQPFQFVDNSPSVGAYLPAGGPGGTGAYAGTSSIRSGPGDNGLAGLSFDSGTRKEPSSRAFTLEVMIKSGLLSSDDSYQELRIETGYGLLFFRRALWGAAGSLLPIPGQPLAWVEFGCLNNYAGILAHSRVRPPGGTTIYPLESSTLYPGLEVPGYHHLAIVQTPGSTSSARTASFYLDGFRLLTVTGLVSVEGQWISNNNESISLGYGPGISSPSPLLHGLRFTPRALYTGSTYVPPTSITSLL